MRFWPRLLLAVVAAALPAGLAMASCSTGAVGVAACQQIEEARCVLAPACTPGFDVGRCQRYYRDDCQNGIQDVDGSVDPNTLSAACITALDSVAGCLDGSTSPVTCQMLIPDASCYEADAAATACNVILACPEVLSACAFVGTEVTDAGAFTSLTSGDYHTCALIAGGGIQCWGSDLTGQLGNGSTANSPVPVGVSGISAGASAVAAGGGHTCALVSGGVQCWGDNLDGDLGNGATAQSSVPVPVSGLSSGVAAIAAGNGSTCALTTGGGVQCWGDNASGQLGNGTTTQSLVPVAVTGLSSGVASIAASNDHVCALTTGGGVQCWGDNASGQLGNNTTTNSPVPVAVTGLSSGVAAIAAGHDHTCALTTGGSVSCWGGNSEGELGNSMTTNSPVPVPVSGLTSGVLAIAAGNGDTCAVIAGGGAMCWGNDANGQLGDNAMTNALVPMAVSGLTSVVAIAAGGEHTCALTTGGGAQCWGYNSNGQLGNNTTTASLVPVPVF